MVLQFSEVAIDLRSVLGAKQAYVVMGRVQHLEQLFLIGSLAEANIYTLTRVPRTNWRSSRLDP